jgi:hypothetical protein
MANRAGTQKEIEMPELKWERIGAGAWSTPGSAIVRAKIPGGWLVTYESSGGLAFVPDPNHQWDGNSLP